MHRRTRFRSRRLYLLAILVFLVLCLPVWLIRGCIIARQLEIIPQSNKITAPVVHVYDKDSRKIVQMNVEDYLVGVVAAEMPASFSEEALKAQAVAARTYTVRKLKIYGGSGCKSHVKADICTDSTCCQAYNSPADLKKKWGNPTYYEGRIREAVLSTQGELVVYNDEPIEAFFHSTAGGYTEDSENAFSAALPYLRSVKSDETGASHYESTKSYTRSAFVSNINKAFKGAKLKANTLENQIEILSRFESGRVDRLRLGGASITGKELRKQLALDSTNITFEYSKKNVVIKTKGYGHGVGMSQTGADAMAKEGSSYKEILLYYYVGTTIEKRW